MRNLESTKLFKVKESQKLNSEKLVLIIDATGVGFGGLTLLFQKTLDEIEMYNEITTIVVGGPTVVTKNTRVVQKRKSKNSRLIAILSSFFYLLSLRRKRNALLFSLSPSLSSIAWLRKPFVQEINDLQSFNSKVKISTFLRLYRRICYYFSLQIATKVITISQNSKQEIIKHFNLRKSIDVIPLSGEIPKMNLENIYDFLIIAHSQHKNAGYVVQLLDVDKFAGCNVAILGDTVLAKKVTSRQFQSDRPRFHAFSKISDNEYYALLNASKVVVMNSEPGTEGFGLPVAQAIFAGKNVVTSNDRALQETGLGSSLILTGDISQDRQILYGAITVANSSNSIFLERTWKEVVSDMVDVFYSSRERNVD